MSKIEINYLENQKLLINHEKGNIESNISNLKPYDLLLASFGTWISETILLYCKRKNWPIKINNISLDLLDTKDRKVLRQTININLYLTGSVSEEQLSRLEYIANKCPIHKILHKSFNIELALFIK